jgi:hypothetical protein
MKPVRPSFVPHVSARLVLAVVVAAAVTFLAPLTSRAQVLQQVPADSLVVIKFAKLKPTSDKIAAFAKKLGVDQLQPAFADPLGNFQKEMGITQGLDPNGEAAIVVLNGPLNQAQQQQQPPVLVLFPVTDYNAFLKNFPNAQTAGEVSTVTVKNNPRPHYVIKRGNYAVLSPKKESLTVAAAQGLTPTGMAAKEMTGKDIVAYVNMKSARTQILPALQKNRAKMLADFEKSFMQSGQQPPRRPGAPGAPGAGADAAGAGAGAAGANAAAADAQKKKFLPLAKAAVNRVLDVAEQVVNDCDAATYGWTFGDTGVQATGLVEFNATSPSGQRIAQLRNSDESLTKGLPPGKYWGFAGTSGNNSELGQKLINDFLAPIEKEINALGPEGKPMQDYLAALKQYAANMKGQSMGWVAPQGLIGQEAVFQIVSVQRGNAPAIQQAAKKMFESQQQLMQAFGGPAQQEIKTNYAANAKNINGVSFDQMQTQFVMPAGGQRTPQQMQAQQMMTWLYGPGGVNAYIGAVGNDKVVTATGVADPMITQLVDAAKGDQDLLGTSPPVASTAAQLPKQRLATWFIQIDNFATSVANYAKAFGMPINFQVPQNLAPLGGTLSSEGSAIRLDGYAPTQTLQSVIAAAMQTYMQMQGGQQPGGPGGL